MFGPPGSPVVSVKNLSVRGCLFPRLILGGKGPEGSWLGEAPWVPLLRAPLAQCAFQQHRPPELFQHRGLAESKCSRLLFQEQTCSGKGSVAL